MKRVITIKVPEIWLEIIDTTIERGIYANRSEAIRNLTIHGLLHLQKFLPDQAKVKIPCTDSKESNT